MSDSLHSLPSSPELVQLLAADGEFNALSDYWTGGLVLNLGGDRLQFGMRDGVVTAFQPGDSDADVIELTGREAIWADFLSTRPSRLKTSLIGLVMAGEIDCSVDLIALAQFYAPIMRAIQLLRGPVDRQSELLDETGATGRHDSPVGRYLHLVIDEVDYRVYYEEAGQGIPLLLQHTAGTQTVQYRHFFENSAITDHFRVIAWDLPFHGKSIPPVGDEWWARQYNLTGRFFRAVTLAMIDALALENPVFFGCSIGSMLALEHAYHSPDVFRHVISCCGGLKTQDGQDSYYFLRHPKVSAETKSRITEDVMGPEDPVPYRKEVAFTQGVGWQQAMVGDLYFYGTEYDMRERAPRIDTAKVGVTIMSGEYDFSGTLEMGAQAHRAIVGSEYVAMPGLGHFPMQENPREFFKHLLPILERIRTAADKRSTHKTR